MNRIEFMNQLESLLQNISPTEREEALQYYNDYFNDAGEENEQSVIEALGNPARVAENIKRDLYGSGYADNTYQRTETSDKALVEYRQNVQQHPTEEKKMSTGLIMLIVIICVFASPILFGVGIGLLGTLFGLITSCFALVFGFGLAAIVLMFVMMVLIIIGIMCAFYSPLVGVAVLGGAFICGGLGILFMMLTIAIAGIATPAICKGIAFLFRKLFRRKADA